MATKTTTEQTQNDWSSFHALSAADRSAMSALREMVNGNKGQMRGVAARAPFDAIMEQVSAPEGVTYDADTIGGVSGLWCKPKDYRGGQAILHIHGGWFNWGSAQAFRHLAGHLALATGVPAFVPDYRLAPEHPFPAAPEDVRACYLGMVTNGFSKIVVTGDSAGGNLALGLANFVAAQKGTVREALAGVVALSPVTELTQTGASWKTRAEADPYFVKEQAAELIGAYLGGHPATDPVASPLFADLAGFPPVRVHVGEDEVLLDDSVRFVERAVAAGVDAHLGIWQGMVHGFLGGVGRLEASTLALKEIGSFITERLDS